ncbi:hypothetical protein JCM6882_008937, partial [Rhodosporidiobolus microsporus]
LHLVRSPPPTRVKKRGRWPYPLTPPPKTPPPPPPPASHVRRKDKSPPHQVGSLVLTTHRLVFVSASRPHRDSVALDLARVRQTEYWGGFIKSSAKITLTVDDGGDDDGAENERADGARAGAEGGGGAARAAGGPGAEGAPAAPSDPERAHQLLASAASSRAWVCRVCGMRNPPSARCSLCGVPNDEPAPSSSSSSSASAPTSRFSTPPPPPRPPLPPARPSSAAFPPPASLDPAETGSRLSCPVCTFLNHHSMTSCEVCGSALFPPLSSTSSLSTTTTSTTSFPSASHPSAHSAPQPSSPAASSPSGTPRPSTPSAAAGALSRPTFVRLSFRAGGASAFYAALKAALGERKWEVTGGKGSGKGSGKSVGGAAGVGEKKEGGEEGVGIDAILRTLSLNTREREDSMDVALKDLESLMGKAKEMIALAQSISTQLNSPAAASSSPSSTASSSEAAQAQSLASSSLLSLGLKPTSTSSSSSAAGLLSSAVTAADAKTEREYHLSLAKELLAVLEGGAVVERMGGIVGLDEVWCFWNRARGVALVPPTDLRHAVSLLSSLPSSSFSSSTSSRPSPPPLALRTFSTTRLSVLHTPHYSLPSFTRRVLDLLDYKSAVVASLAEPEVVAEGLGVEDEGQREGAGLLELARAEGGGVSVGLVRELVALVEMGDPDRPPTSSSSSRGARAGGRVCRDEQGGVGGGGSGVRWYRNWISEAQAGGWGWDGQVF